MVHKTVFFLFMTKFFYSHCRKDTEPLYHYLMYSLVSLLSGIYPLPAMHSLLVALYVTEYLTGINQKYNWCSRFGLQTQNQIKVSRRTELIVYCYYLIKIKIWHFKDLVFIFKIWHFFDQNFDLVFSGLGIFRFSRSYGLYLLT